MAVLVYHLEPRWLPGGFTGVDIFFVISGYVVSGSLARDQARHFLSFTLGFYARRILRIFPALILCLLLVMLASIALIPEAWLSETSHRTGLFAFFGVSNVALVLFDDGYFSPRAEFNPFTHTWSLGVEEQFYVVFPLIFFVWIHFRHRRGLAGLSAEALLVVLMAASLVYAWWETPRSLDHAFYLLPSRFWELAAGGLLFKLHQRGVLIARNETQRILFLTAGLGLVMFGLGWSDKGAMPFPWALPAVLGTSLVIAAIAVAADKAAKPWPQRLLEHPAAIHVGKISYSLYLWHWPVYVMMRWTLGLEYGWQLLMAVLLSFLLAEASYRFVEVPVRRNGWSRRQANWKTVTAGVATIVLSFSVAQEMLNSRAQLSLSVTKDRELWYPLAWPGATGSHEQDLQGRQLFALGDSHAGAYATMLQALSERRGVVTTIDFAGACTPASLLRNAGPACVDLVEQALQRIEGRALPGDIVFLAALRMYRFVDQYAVFPRDQVIAARDSVADREKALEEANYLLERLLKQGLEVVIDAPKPVFLAPPFRCADWFNRHNPICAGGMTMPREMLVEHRAGVMDSLQRLQQRFPALHVWDPFPILCPGSTCSAFDGEKPLFFDADHLSAYGNQVLYPSFEDLVSAIWSVKQLSQLDGSGLK
ncbi:acyltransferase family protein [Thiorhodovibrio winogradskyi]